MKKEEFTAYIWSFHISIKCKGKYTLCILTEKNQRIPSATDWFSLKLWKKTPTQPKSKHKLLYADFHDFKKNIQIIWTILSDYKPDPLNSQTVTRFSLPTYLKHQ